jgi:hypothetical protein
MSTNDVLSTDAGGRETGEWETKIKEAKEARKQGAEKLKQNPRPPTQPSQMRRQSGH